MRQSVSVAACERSWALQQLEFLCCVQAVVPLADAYMALAEKTFTRDKSWPMAEVHLLYVVDSRCALVHSLCTSRVTLFILKYKRNPVN